jgi:hypothetical protein
MVFGKVPEAGEALAGLIAVGILCRTDDKEFPLLPARYHLALSGIEGVSVRLDGTHPESWSALAGKRAAGGPEDAFWPLLTCRNCGQPYIEAYGNGEVLAPRGETQRAERMVLWLGEPDRLLRTDEVGGEDGEEPDEAAPEERVTFGSRTGRLAGPADAEAITLASVPLERDEDEQRFYVEKRRCPACGYVERRFAEPIAAMRPGDEPLAAVAAQHCCSRRYRRRLSASGGSARWMVASCWCFPTIARMLRSSRRTSSGRAATSPCARRSARW